MCTVHVDMYSTQLNIIIIIIITAATRLPQLCSWPARNATPFHYLNMTMERCNDLLELVQTIEHFRYMYINNTIIGLALYYSYYIM